MRFPEHRLQFAPKLRIVDVPDFRIVKLDVGLLGRINESARREWAAFAPAVAVVVNPGDEILVLSQFQ